MYSSKFVSALAPPLDQAVFDGRGGFPRSSHLQGSVGPDRQKVGGLCEPLCATADKEVTVDSAAMLYILKGVKDRERIRR
jgi:hypothetical protein